jgi:serine/threonine protein kinase
VYRCENQETGEKGVVKFVLTHEMTIDTIDALREVYTAQQFAGHSHIVSPTSVAITAMDENDMQKLAIVMPEADRGDMDNVITELSDKPLVEKAPVFLKLLADSADGLVAMHSKGFVHRDIKPGNIFVKTGSDGEPVGMLGDLGNSRHESSFGPLEGGSIPYVPADSEVGLSMDTYAFGMMSFHLLSGGEFPFSDTPKRDPISGALPMPDQTTLKAMIDEKVSNASDEVKSLIQRSLSEDPSARPMMTEWRETLAKQAV